MSSPFSKCLLFIPGLHREALWPVPLLRLIFFCCPQPSPAISFSTVGLPILLSGLFTALLLNTTAFIAPPLPPVLESLFSPHFFLFYSQLSNSGGFLWHRLILLGSRDQWPRRRQPLCFDPAILSLCDWSFFLPPPAPLKVSVEEVNLGRFFTKFEPSIRRSNFPFEHLTTCPIREDHSEAPPLANLLFAEAP